MQDSSVWRRAAVVLVALTGVVAFANGVYFIVGDHPFNGENDYSEEIAMSKADAEANAPAVADWTMHVSDQVGSVSAGWGLFIIGLAVTGLRRGVPFARNVLWLGGLPTLVFSAFGEWVQFGHVDTGTMMSMIALVLFVTGMGLSYVSVPQRAPGDAAHERTA